MIPKKPDTFSGLTNPNCGLDLFYVCQEFARKHYGLSQGQAMPPGGARLFYYVRLHLLRLGLFPAVEPDTTALPQHVVQQFSQEVPFIATRLAADFGGALRLVKQPEARLARLLAKSTVLKPLELPWAPEHLQGISRSLNHSWRQFWKRYWRTAIQAQQEAILTLLRPERLLVAEIARPSETDDVALTLLREHLAQDRLARQTIPSAETYQYEEPLSEWLLSPLMTNSQLLDFCQAMALWMNQIPGIVQRRSALVETDNFSRNGGRRTPLLPNGAVTGEALFYFSTALWRQSHAADLLQEIKLDHTPIEPAAFQQRLACVIQVAEQLLWDEPGAMLTQANEAEKLDRALEEALLPGRLRSTYRTLLPKDPASGSVQQPSRPRWEAWESLLGTVLCTLKTRLATTLVPASITRERLDTLLQHMPLAPHDSYLYDRSFGAWCRTALPDQILLGRHLLAFCQLLAETLGTWPAGVDGAPSSPEAAARAICWYTKLALEARIGPALLREATSSLPLPPSHLPQRADGGLAVWLDDPLPAAAESLAAAIAPLIAGVLHRMTRQADRQAKPLLLKRLKTGDLASWAEMGHFLQEHARFLGHPAPKQAAEEAAEKLRTQFLYLLLPADISEGFLAGDRQTLQSEGWFDGNWYLQRQNAYQCLASPHYFARAFIRFPSTCQNQHREDVSSLEQVEEEPSYAGSLVEEVDVRGALEVIIALGDSNSEGAKTAPSTTSPQNDQITLLRLLWATPTARSLIADLARQQVPAALSIQQHRETLAAQKQVGGEDQAAGAQDSWASAKALAWLFAQPGVTANPQVRQALTDLFEIPVQQDHHQGPDNLSLGMLERVGALAFRPSQRAVVLEALDVLGGLASKQRRMISIRLLKRADIALLLMLLEASGWKRPPWLAYRDQERRMRGCAAAGGSVQLFHTGRKNWLQRLSAPAHPGGWQARGMVNEWLGLHFWSGLWQRSAQEQAPSFYRLTLAALPEPLCLVMGTACRLASKEHLATLPEMLGLVGALPPQLPAQLDSPTFFRELYEMLSELPGWSAYQEDMSSSDEELWAMHRIRRQLQVARCRILTWVRAISGLQHEQEYRVLLAAVTLANGKPERLQRWLRGNTPSREEARAMCSQMQHQNHHVVLTPESLTGYLASAGRQLKSTWARLHKDV